MKQHDPSAPEEEMEGSVLLRSSRTKSDACPGVDMKYAGTVRRVNTGRLSQLLDSGDIVLVGCLGYSASVPPSTDSPDGAGITHRWFRAPIRAKFSIARRRRSPRNVPPRSSALALPLFFVSLSSHPWWADVPQLGAQKLIFMYEGDEVFNLEHVCSGGADGQVVQSMDPDLAGRCIAAIEEQRALPTTIYLFRLLFRADLSPMTLSAIIHHMPWRHHEAL